MGDDSSTSLTGLAGAGCMFEFSEEILKESPWLAEYVPLLRDRLWRLDRLYLILVAGQATPLEARPEQQRFREQRHTRNFVPKARKLGMSTEIVLENGDECLFSPNFKAAIIDRTAGDAYEKLDIFRFAWVNGPRHPDPIIAAIWKAIHEVNPLETDNSGEMVWRNGSSLQAGTSFTGRTPQRLHVSEFGPICDASEMKGHEILQGSINAVLPHDVVDVETTMRSGQTGACAHLFGLAKRGGGSPSSIADWKLHFFSWLGHPDYRLPGRAASDAGVVDYFRKLKEGHGLEVSDEQQAWYEVKRREQGHRMMQEYPSTVEECDKALVAGAIYPEMATVRLQGRVREFLPEPGLPIFTFWDLGVSDNSAGWCIQPTSRDIHVLAWSAGEGLGAAGVAAVVREWGQWFGGMTGTFLPHDADLRDKGSGKSFRTQLLECGLMPGAVHVVPRTTDVWVGINEVRRRLHRMWFHARCDVPVHLGERELPSGVGRLEGYRKGAPTSSGILREHPLGDVCSHTADALRTFAEADAIGMIAAAASAMNHSGFMASGGSAEGARVKMGMRGA